MFDRAALGVPLIIKLVLTLCTVGKGPWVAPHPMAQIGMAVTLYVCAERKEVGGKTDRSIDYEEVLLRHPIRPFSKPVSNLADRTAVSHVVLFVFVFVRMCACAAMAMSRIAACV